MPPEPWNIAHLLADYDRPWGFCGGWAIDLFLDRESRPHKDVDVAVLRRDQQALRFLLTTGGWSLEKAHNGQLTPWLADEELQLPLHTIWCRHPNFAPNFLEVLLNEATPTDFLFRRDRTIMFPLNRAFLTSRSGLPILAPEIVLLYKAKPVVDLNYTADFHRVRPFLNLNQRGWLKMALARLHPDHDWLYYL